MANELGSGQNYWVAATQREETVGAGYGGVTGDWSVPERDEQPVGDGYYDYINRHSESDDRFGGT
jgi:hypothetical protein